MSEDPTPYLLIQIISTTEKNEPYSELLSIIKDQIDHVNILNTSWIRNGSNNPKLLVSTESKELFIQFFKQDFYLLDRIVQFSSQNNINIQDYFPAQIDVDMDRNNKIDNDKGNLDNLFSNYLILKYTTSYKRPIRENLRYFQWFSEQIHEFTQYEEIADGFLRYYHRKIDFLSNNFNRNTPQGIEEWLKLKKAQIPPEILNQIFNLVNS